MGDTLFPWLTQNSAASQDFRTFKIPLEYKTTYSQVPASSSKL